MSEYTQPGVSHRNQELSKRPDAARARREVPELFRFPSELTAKQIRELGEKELGDFTGSCKATGVQVIQLKGGSDEFDAMKVAGQIDYDKVYWRLQGLRLARLLNLPPRATNCLPTYLTENLEEQSKKY